MVYLKTNLGFLSCNLYICNLIKFLRIPDNSKYIQKRNKKHINIILFHSFYNYNFDKKPKHIPLQNKCFTNPFIFCTLNSFDIHFPYIFITYKK